MKVVAISDQHGNLPKIPSCDLLLIGGDICPATDHSLDFQEYWLNTTFRWWLEKISAKKIVGIAGNHDLIFQNKPRAVPSLPWTYLQDSATEFEGLKIWGTPWQPYFFDWAFNLYEKELCDKWALIPKDADIIVVHGPPHGYGDKAPRANRKGYENTGSLGLLEKIKEVKPKLCVFGHIHPGRGQWKLNDTILANVTLLNDKYEMVHDPMVFEEIIWQQIEQSSPA